MFAPDNTRPKTLFFEECAYCTSSGQCANCIKREKAVGHVCQSDMDIGILSYTETHVLVLTKGGRISW